MTRNINFRVTSQEHERLKEIAGPYGKLGPLLRELVKNFIKKQEAKAS